MKNHTLLNILRHELLIYDANKKTKNLGNFFDDKEIKQIRAVYEKILSLEAQDSVPPQAMISIWEAIQNTDKKIGLASNAIQFIKEQITYLDVVKSFPENQRLEHVLKDLAKIESVELKKIIPFFAKSDAIALVEKAFPLETEDGLENAMKVLPSNMRLGFAIKHEHVIKTASILPRILSLLANDVTEQALFASRHKQILYAAMEFSGSFIIDNVIEFLPDQLALDCARLYQGKIQRLVDLSNIAKKLPKEVRLDFLLNFCGKLEEKAHHIYFYEFIEIVQDTQRLAIVEKFHEELDIYNNDICLAVAEQILNRLPENHKINLIHLFAPKIHTKLENLIDNLESPTERAALIVHYPDKITTIAEPIALLETGHDSKYRRSYSRNYSAGTLRKWIAENPKDTLIDLIANIPDHYAAKSLLQNAFKVFENDLESKLADVVPLPSAIIKNIVLPFFTGNKIISNCKPVQATPDFFERFLKQTGTEQQQLISQFKRKFIDLDNDSITHSAAQMLLSFGIDDFCHIQLGPDAPGRYFDLAQLSESKLSECRYEYHHYAFFVIATLQGQHAVAIVIDRQERNIYYIDPQGNQYGAQSEARTRLDEVTTTDKVPRLKGYKLIPSKGLAGVQQPPGDTNCGLYAVANIVGIILKLEGMVVKSTSLYQDVKNPLIYPIDITQPGDIRAKKPEELRIWLGAILLAYEAYGEQLNKKVMPVR